MGLLGRPASAVLAAVFAGPMCGIDAARPPAIDTAKEARPRPCRVDGVETEVLCATLPVWEDRGARSGRRIGLNIVILPATGQSPAPDPVVVLAGGPGQAATSLAPAFAPRKDLRARRAIVLVDQRGTGGSNPLACDFYGDPPDLTLVARSQFPIGPIRECRKRLEAIADLRRYSTANGMDDLDEVRSWLGHSQVNLYGGSYGTMAAQVYLRRHEKSVRSVVLDAVMPIDEPLPLHHAWAGQRAIDRVFAECAADPACARLAPHPGDELKAVLDRIRQGVQVEIEDRNTGRRVSVRPAVGVVAEGLRHFLYDADAGRSLPPLIHRAFRGELAPLVQTAVDSQLDIHGILAEGMLLSVSCSEHIPFIDPTEVPRETKDTFLGDSRVREQTQACAEWPRTPVAPEDRAPVRSEVPVLLLSGEKDPATPPEFAERVASRLPNSLSVVFPKGAHGGSGPCGEALVATFIERGSVRDLDRSCVDSPAPTPPTHD
jgi:pimeloyl-ACP methyl ester carboxylesterase